MLRPVELDATADPRPRKPHQRGLDNLVIIHKIVSVGFIVGTLNTAAQFRQHHHAQVVVFKPYGVIGLVGLFIAQGIDHRQRIHLAATALIHALFEEHGVDVRLSHFVGGDQHLLLPNLSLPGHMLHAGFLLCLFAAWGVPGSHGCYAIIMPVADVGRACGLILINCFFI